MSIDRETTIVRAWLRTDEHESAERVLGIVLDRLDTTPQHRRGWGTWRARLLSGALKFAAAGVVAVALAAVVSVVYFSRPQGPAATSSPAAATPVASIPLSVVQPTIVAPGRSPWIAFIRAVDFSQVGPARDALWAMRSDGSEAHQLLEKFGGSSIAWSQDGSRLLVVTADTDGVGHVKVAEVAEKIGPFVDTGFTTGSDTACNAKSGRPALCQDSNFSFAPDGQRVVFVQRCTDEAMGCYFLTILDLRTGELTELDATFEDVHNALALPAWSPDGSTIAFAREGDTWELYLIGADGTNLRQVDLGGLSVTAPQWSSDDSTIALSSVDWLTPGDLDQDIYTVESDGSGLRRITTDGTSRWPVWRSSDQIRFQRGVRSAGQTFWTMNADGSNATLEVDLDPYLEAIRRPPGSVDRVLLVDDGGPIFHWQPER